MEAATPPKDSQQEQDPKPARRTRPKTPPEATPTAPSNGRKTRLVKYDVHEFREFFRAVRDTADAEPRKGELVTLPICIATDVAATHRRDAIDQAVKDRDPQLDEDDPDSPWGVFGTIKSGERMVEQPRHKQVTIAPAWE